VRRYAKATGIGAQTLQQMSPEAKRVPVGETPCWTPYSGTRHTPGVPAARILRLDAIAPFAMGDGIRARALFGESAMLNLVELAPGAIVAEHSHPHEQLGIGLRGLITMVIDGEEHPLGPMDAMYIPSGVVHTGIAGPEGALVLDVFTPIREDFRALADAAATAAD
jgi:quercetin dioxygenase-like cupin family protein